MHLIGEDPSNMPHLFNPLATLVLPSQAANANAQQQNSQLQQLQQQQQQQQQQQHMFANNGSNGNGILQQTPQGVCNLFKNLFIPVNFQKQNTN